jgi:CRP/FNR family transcriptional regulator, cyclic AMP receptor protein
MAGAPVDLIQRVPLFADLDGKELGRVAASFKERDFSAGDTLVGEDAGPSRFFVIGEGTANVTVHGEERGKLGKGDYFGEIALIDGGVRTATVAADTDMKVYSLTLWEFRPLVDQNSAIAWKLLEALAKRIRDLEAR